MDLFIPKETLDLLSYRSTLEQMKEFIDKVAQLNRAA